MTIDSAAKKLFEHLELPNQVAIGNKIIGQGRPIFVVAEIGCNHNGNVELAKKMIEEAAKAGADAVKFQKRDVDETFIKEMRDQKQTKPLVFGKNKNKGIVMENCAPKTVEFDAGKPPSTIMRHDEKAPPEHAFQLTRFAPPEFPVPVGVFRQTDELSHEEKMAELTKAAAKPGGDTLEALLSGPDAWEINPSTPKS